MRMAALAIRVSIFFPHIASSLHHPVPFRFGRSEFGQFHDLQAIAHTLGFQQQASLAYVSRHVLGAALQKDDSISASNWERLTLTKAQVTN